MFGVSKQFLHMVFLVSKILSPSFLPPRSSILLISKILYPSYFRRKYPSPTQFLRFSHPLNGFNLFGYNLGDQSHGDHTNTFQVYFGRRVKQRQPTKPENLQYLLWKSLRLRVPISLEVFECLLSQFVDNT